MSSSRLTMGHSLSMQFHLTLEVITSFSGHHADLESTRQNHNNSWTLLTSQVASKQSSFWTRDRSCMLLWLALAKTWATRHTR